MASLKASEGLNQTVRAREGNQTDVCVFFPSKTALFCKANCVFQELCLNSAQLV